MSETTNDTAPPPGPPPPPPGPSGPGDGWNRENLTDYRRLRRSRSDRKIAGVAGGLGRHLNIDPTILRVLFVVLIFFGGAGVLLYGALWLVVPEEHTEKSVVGTSDSTRNVVLVVVAVIAALLVLGDSWGRGFPWPLAVVGLVIAVVLLARDRNDGGRQPVPPPPAYPPPAPGSAPDSAPDDATRPLVDEGSQPPPWYPPTPPPPVRPDPRRSGPLLFGLTLAVLAVALGALGLYDASGGSVNDAAYPALGLAVVGAMLLLGAFVGRAGGLIALGLVGVLALVATGIGGPSFEGSRDQTIRPASAADVADHYQVPAGRIDLDLTDVRDLEALDGRSITIEANAGELLVAVPDGLHVDYDADIQYGGAITTPAGERDGWASELAGQLGDPENDPSIHLNIDLKFGHIEVRQQ